ncbi:MAG: hypothetical protein JW995_01215 [Melioribacteraceae bacterium]|nr:hypothetical protein [Melioribacteraceae bacterium]
MLLNEHNIEFLKSRFSGFLYNENRISMYTNHIDEYNLIRHGSALRIIPASIFLLEGNDVQDFVHRISTNDVSRLNYDMKIHTLFTNEKGRIIDQTVFIRFENGFQLIGNLVNKNMLLRWIERFIITEDVKIKDATGDKMVIEIIGPQAESYLTMICGKCIDSLDYSNVIKADVEGITVHITKFEEKNSVGIFWILIDKKDFNDLGEYFLAQKSVFDFGFAGEKAYDIYRIEEGIPGAPNELNDKFNPHEADILNQVSFTKGCYIGQEVIARLDTYDKVQRTLTQFIFDEDFEFNGDLIEVQGNDDEEIAIITSLTKSLKYNAVLGLGYFRKKMNGKEYKPRIKINNKEIQFTVKTLGKE